MSRNQTKTRYKIVRVQGDRARVIEGFPLNTKLLKTILTVKKIFYIYVKTH